MPSGDRTLAYLLELDGEEIVYDGGFVARFSARRVKATLEKPHGISYSLTLHGPDGRRLMGYDNAHGVPHRGGKFVRRHATYDHWHRDETDQGRPYRFKDAGKLIGDFFDEVERILKEVNHGRTG